MADEDASLDNDSAENSGVLDAVEDRPGLSQRRRDLVSAMAEETPGLAESAPSGHDPAHDTPYVDEAAEDLYWAEAYGASPYLRTEWDYKVFQPACRYGWQSFRRFHGRTFDEVEAELGVGWELHRGETGPNWAKAREAARGAWNRVERAWRRQGRQ